jgi:integrase
MNEIEKYDNEAIAAQANAAAQRHAFGTYREGLAANTKKAHRIDLDSLVEFLVSVGVKPTGDMAQNPEAWRHFSWGLLAAFRQWLLGKGYSIGTVNRRLATVRRYAALASEAGVLSPEAIAMVQTVHGYGGKKAWNVDDARLVAGVPVRIGRNKQKATRLTPEQVALLLAQPDTPVGRRDGLLVAMLLVHGLRSSELAALRVSDIDLASGEFEFRRVKTATVGHHKLTSTSAAAIARCADAGELPDNGPLLRAVDTKGRLTDRPLSLRGLRARLTLLGLRVGVKRLSPHDLRHDGATFFAGRVGAAQLKRWGGWKRFETADKYVEWAEVDNVNMDR